MVVAAYVYANTLADNESIQRMHIHRWLDKNRFSQSQVQWYRDREHKTEINRRELEQLNRDIEAGSIKTVVIYDLNRLTNSMKASISLIERWCKQDIRIVIVSKNIDICENKQTVAALLAAIAQMDYEVRRERQAIGIEVAKLRGIYKGRPKGTFSVKYWRAVRMRKKGLTLKRIAKKLKIDISTVNRYLKHARALEEQQQAKLACKEKSTGTNYCTTTIAPQAQ